MTRFLKVLSLSFFILVFALPLFVFAQGGDPLESLQWYLEKLKAPQAWEVTVGSEEVVVAVLDTGVDQDHPDIQGNIWLNEEEIADDGVDNDNNGYIDDVNGWNFLKSDETIEPDIYWGFDQQAIHHGTFVAGLISAIHDNQEGIKGLTSKVKIMPLVTMNAYGYGDSYPVAEAINYAIDNGADVINLSFGGYTHSTALKSSIRRAYENNVVIVASAANDGYDLADYPVYPICYDREWDYNQIIGVGSVGMDDTVSAFSNYGEGCVDIFAPGDGIASLGYLHDSNLKLKEAYIKQWEGTSFATPLVSGTVALMKSANKTLTNSQIFNLLSSNSVFLDIDKKYWTNKRLDVYSSVLAAAKAEGGIKYKESTPLLISYERSGTANVSQYNLLGTLLKEEVLLSGESFKGLSVNSVVENNHLDKKYVVGATEGALPFVRVVNQESEILSSFLAFEGSFKAGLEVAAGDIDEDGSLEILVAVELENKIKFRIFNLRGNLEKEFNLERGVDWGEVSFVVL